MEEGPPVSFADSVKPMRDSSDDPSEKDEYSVRTKWQQHPDKENYGSVTDRGVTLDISTPVDEISQLQNKTHLHGQLHRHNQDQWDNKPLSNDGNTLYDLAILDIADRVLDIENIEVQENGIPARRLNVLFLQQARGLKNCQEILNYLSTGKQSVLNKSGYDDPSLLPSYDTLHNEIRKGGRLSDELDDGLEAFDRAVVRAIYAVYRNGIEPPDQVSEQYGFNQLQPSVVANNSGSAYVEQAVDRDKEKEARRNWINLLIDETVPPLNFNRKNPKFDYRHFLALFAASAFCDAGLQTVADVADYDYDRENIPKGSGLPKYIKNRFPDNRINAQSSNQRTIEQQFDAVHKNTLALAKKYGFFSDLDSISLASDIYRIDWNGKENSMTIDRPEKSESDVRSQWTYNVLGIINTEAPFTLGTRLLTRKDQYPEATAQVFSNYPNDLDVSALYADAEIVSGTLLNQFKQIAGDDAVVKAPDHDKIKNLKRPLSEKEVGFVPSFGWSTEDEINLVVYPDVNSDDVPDDLGSDLSVIQIDPRYLKQTQENDDAEFHHNNQTSLDSFSTDKEECSVGNGTEKPELLSSLADTDDRSSSAIGKYSTHDAFFTYRSLLERSSAGISVNYYQRWAIEDSIRQIKNDFMPVIESDDPRMRVYGVNVAILFQNWHTLMNRAHSPELGLRCTITHQEMLKVIQHVVFGDTIN